MQHFTSGGVQNRASTEGGLEMIVTSSPVIPLTEIFSCEDLIWIFLSMKYSDSRPKAIKRRRKWMSYPLYVQL